MASLPRQPSRILDRRSRPMRRFRMICFAFITVAVSIASADSVASIDNVAEPSLQKIDFDTQIIPLLTRHGCNAGSCHGAAIGRGGFKLSLLGSDAAADHAVITRAMEGRRVNHFDVDRSLLLLKPSEQIGHEGGLVFDEDSRAFNLLRTWIEQGARRIESRELKTFKVVPQDELIDGLGPRYVCGDGHWYSQYIQSWFPGRC